MTTLCSRLVGRIEKGELERKGEWQERKSDQKFEK